MELKDDIHQEIVALSRSGNALVEQGKYVNALYQYWQAFDLLPEPKTAYEAATWLLAAIGDTNFLRRDFQVGVDNLGYAMQCPSAIGNPFLHLRLGQCHFEIGNLEKAADELTRAYAIAGEEIFQEDDPKYFEFLKNKIVVEKPKPKKKPWWKL